LTLYFTFIYHKQLVTVIEHNRDQSTHMGVDMHEQITNVESYILKKNSMIIQKFGTERAENLDEKKLMGNYIRPFKIHHNKCFKDVEALT